MRHGQISNHSAPIVAFNVDHLLFKKKKEEGIVDKVISHILSFLEDPEVDYRFVKLLLDVWDNREPYCIYLYTSKTDQEFDDLESFLDERDIRYTRLKPFLPLQAMQFIVANQCLFYFDTDIDYITSLGTNNAKHISEVGSCIGLGYTFPQEGGIVD